MSTTVTLRPSATRTPPGTTGIVGVGGGVTIHGATSDNNTTTGVKATVDGAWCDLDLTDTTLTSVQRVKTVTVRAFVARTAADLGHTQRAVYYLRDADGKNSTDNDLMGTSNASGINAVGHARASLAGREFTQTRVNAMRLAVYWKLLGSVQWLEVRELYVDLDVRTQPSVASVTVTGATSTTRPTVSWTPTTDVDPATRWQVKVFSADQYGASNFSPATAVSKWDSGVVLGDAVSADVDTDLVNGVTYKAFVAIAQDWTGVPDTQWWSDWTAAGAASSAFTIALTPPATPTLAVSTLATVPGYRVLLDVSAPVNLLTADNASFESSTGQWVAETNCSISRVTTDAADGAASLQLSSTAGGTMVANSGNEPFLGLHVDGGVQYTALGSARAGATGRTCRVGFRWQDAAGAQIGSNVFGSTFSDITGSYTQGSVTATAPANAKTARVVAEVQSTGGAAELHRWDKFSLHVGASTTWTPGGMGSHLVVVERGERVDAGRGPRENWAHPDVASAGSVRQTTGYGFGLVADSGQDMLGWEYLDKDIPGGGPSGMVHWQTRSGAASGLDIGTWPYGGPGSEEWRFPVVVGQPHVISYWAWVASGTLAVTPRILWIADDMVNSVSTSSGSPVTLTTTPQQITYSATAAAGAAGAQGRLSNHTSSATADIYLTQVGWGHGTTAVDDKPPAGGPLVWTTVRGTAAPQISGFPYGYDTGQRVVFADYEAPPARPLLYRARLTATLSASALASPYSAYATVYPAAPARGILRDPFRPDRPVPIWREDSGGLRMTIPEEAETFRPLGRDADPVTIRDWIGGNDGSVTLAVTSDADLLRLLDLIRSARPLLLQWPQGGQTYLRVISRETSPVMLERGAWTVPISYLETARP